MSKSPVNKVIYGITNKVLHFVQKISPCKYKYQNFQQSAISFKKKAKC